MAEQLGLDVLVPGDRPWSHELADLRDQVRVVLLVRGDTDLFACLDGKRAGIVGTWASTS